jgi:hypothetical protein
MLEPHLAEKKHQEESKLWHPKPPACTNFLHATLHWENRKDEKEHSAEGSRCTKHTGEGGRKKELISMQTFSKQRLEMQKGWQWVGDKLLPEIGQIVFHKDHLLSPWATHKVKWCCKIEKQSANQHNMLTAGSRLKDLWPCPRESEQGKETSPQ